MKQNKKIEANDVLKCSRHPVGWSLRKVSEDRYSKEAIKKGNVIFFTKYEHCQKIKIYQTLLISLGCLGVPSETQLVLVQKILQLSKIQFQKHNDVFFL